MDVFLGSSKDLRDLRLAFSALVDTLADASLDADGPDVVARLWETESYAMERDRSKQEAYDVLLRACDLAFFLVDGTLGAYTLHEFEVACAALGAAGAPAVTVWLRAAEADGADEARDDNTEALLAQVQVQPAVCVRPLTNEDELLLDMTQVLCEQLEGIPLTVRAGGLWCGHQRLANLAGVSEQALHAFEAWLVRASEKGWVA